MGKAMATDAVDCIDCYREELLIYLVQRFGSLSFAQRIFAETQVRLADSNILDCVPNPHIYLISYALSLGLEFMQADAVIPPCTHHLAIAGGESWHPQAISTLH